MKKSDSDPIVAELDDPSNPSVKYTFTRTDLIRLVGQLDSSELLIVLANQPQVVLAGVKDALVIPIEKPGEPPQPPRNYPLVIQATRELEGNLGQGLVTLCKALYGVEPYEHQNHMLLMVPQARVLPAPKEPDKSLPSGQKA